MSDQDWKRYDDLSDDLYVQIVYGSDGYHLVDRYELTTPLSPSFLNQQAVAWWLFDNKLLVAEKQAANLVSA